MEEGFRTCTWEEYEPSEEHHPMHTDPLCANCGAPKSEHK